MNKKLIRLTESDLHRIVRMSVNKILRENIKPNRRNRRMMNEGLIPTSLRKFMREYYDNDSSCSSALELLMDDSFIEEQGWMRVFHEGYGDGVYSPKESIVAVFDVDDVPEYHSFHLYKFNPKTWKTTDGDGWDNIYGGDNGGNFDVEPV